MKKTTIPVNTVPAKEDELAVAKATETDPSAANNEANDTAGAAAVSVPQTSHCPPTQSYN